MANKAEAAESGSQTLYFMSSSGSSPWLQERALVRLCSKRKCD